MENMTSPVAYIHNRHVEFADTDAAGIAHFSRLLVMVEAAEHAWFKSLNIPILSTQSAWPCVSLDVTYKSKCEFGDELYIQIQQVTLGNSSLTYKFHAAKASNPQAAFAGTMTKCHIDPASGKSIPISDEVRNALGNLPQQAI